MKKPKYKIGDVVVAKIPLHQDASGDHPCLELCREGQQLTITGVYPRAKFMYSVQDVEGAYGHFAMAENELGILQ